MDFFLEIIAEAYFEIAIALTPNKKLKKWQEFLLKFINLIVSITIIGMIATGATVLIEKNAPQTTGIVLLAVGCGLLLIQIGIVIFALVKEKQRKDAEKLNASERNAEENKKDIEF